MLKRTIIENSLKDKSILDRVQIKKTWHAGDWVLHSVLVDENTAQNIGQYLSDGPWYIHFWESGKDDVLVVFKDKVFQIKFSDKTTWTDAIAHGKSIGIPDEQLDFQIE